MKALLHSVPLGRLVVLDLFAEVKPIWSTSQHFYGVPYIWKVLHSYFFSLWIIKFCRIWKKSLCMLHNFAGNIEMYGILDSVASGPIEALSSVNSTMVGIGMSMEGIEQNSVVYDLMAEMAFQHKKVNVTACIDRYPARHYGQTLALVQDAWNILYHTIYNCTNGAYDKNRDVIVAFPDVDPSFISMPHERNQNYKRPMSRRAALKEETISYDLPHLWYSTSEVVHALELFIESGDELSSSSTYGYDLVDLTRQALAKYANQLFLEIIEAYQSRPWLESAMQLARNKEQEKQFEWNARTQITMWFDNTEEVASLLRDYGNKYWSGLL
ncbi:hypothetical protein SLA2020_257990 [Shorea laevis]